MGYEFHFVPNTKALDLLALALALRLSHWLLGSGFSTLSLSFCMLVWSAWPPSDPPQPSSNLVATLLPVNHTLRLSCPFSSLRCLLMPLNRALRLSNPSVSVIEWILSLLALVYSFFLSSSLVLGHCPIIFLLEHLTIIANVPRYGGQLFCNGVIGPLKSPKIEVSVYIEEYIQTWEKFAKTLFIRLQISIIPPYTSIGSAF